ncbi:hypothetical protein [Yoonia sediminilitoris]|uniref:Uncharacterized protein n=1 Tax=Yoonia sediminilitoris TaxID=1286148 RepID=A0A2T6KHF3_9RHOB|nr:hypothetical protein [Yoonia sediminilitoris]PUB14927.1 hypothetical protein C8N45_105150 [Yoonia sediminilitoris]RCW95644.1 hypothetical protein DFP92_105150 [Yoonia sediminilitoris]
MSAPQTNVEKQAKRHRFPLLGMGGVVILAGLLFIALLTWTAYNADDAQAPAPATQATQ